MPGDIAVVSFKNTGIDQFIHIGDGQAQFCQQTIDHLGNDAAVTGISGPAFFPHVVILLVRPPVMIDKFMADRIGSFVFSDHIAIADHQSGCTVTKPHFVEIGGPGFATV